MRKSLFLMFVALISCSTLFAGVITRPGFIRLRPTSNPGPTLPLPPPIRPFSASDAIPFSLYAFEEELLLVSESCTSDVSIVLESVDGVVFSSNTAMAAGSEVAIPTAGLPEGAYAIYIEYGDEVLVGEFEVE